LLGIKHVIVAVNKMDLVDYSQARYKEIQEEYLTLAGSLDIPDIRFVPISALEGDNVVNPSEKLSWFRGSTLMQYLETMEISASADSPEFRFPVQLVSRPNSDFRGFAGSIAAGTVAVGDTIRVLPAGTISTVKSIVTFDGELTEAHAPQAVTLTLNDEIDISRGNMLVKKDVLAHVSSRLRAKLIWMHEQPMKTERDYYFKFACKLVSGEVAKLHHRIDVNTLEERDAQSLGLNEIGLVDINLTEAVAFDAYLKNKQTGAFIVIDRLTNLTVAAGMVDAALTAQPESQYDPQQEQEITGLSSFELEFIQLLRKHFPELSQKGRK
jgi:sulfate adenylyltransferase subunit 1